MPSGPIDTGGERGEVHHHLVGQLDQLAAPGGGVGLERVFDHRWEEVALVDGRRRPGRLRPRVESTVDVFSVRACRCAAAVSAAAALSHRDGDRRSSDEPDSRGDSLTDEDHGDSSGDRQREDAQLDLREGRNRRGRSRLGRGVARVEDAGRGRRHRRLRAASSSAWIRAASSIWFRSCRANLTFGGGIVASSAMSGIEQACWDILGKSLGVPVYQLLGGAVRDRVRMYDHLGGGEMKALYLDDAPQVMAERALESVAAGYTAVKVLAVPRTLPVDGPRPDASGPRLRWPRSGRRWATLSISWSTSTAARRRHEHPVRRGIGALSPALHRRTRTAGECRRARAGRARDDYSDRDRRAAGRPVSNSARCSKSRRAP